MYSSVRNASGCMLEGQNGPPEPGEITEAQVRRHKGLSREEFKSEKTKGMRFIKRGLIIHRFCEWMDTKPVSWYQMSTGFGDAKLQRHLKTLSGTWPWNIKACKWTPGKMLMALRESAWKEFESTGIPVKEPHLRVMRLAVDEADNLNRRFAAAYKRAINRIGASRQ
jgi:hypothetical protein